MRLMHLSECRLGTAGSVAVLTGCHTFEIQVVHDSGCFHYTWGLMLQKLKGIYFLSIFCLQCLQAVRFGKAQQMINLIMESGQDRLFWNNKPLSACALVTLDSIDTSFTHCWSCWFYTAVMTSTGTTYRHCDCW